MEQGLPDREKVIRGLESLRDICNAKADMAIGEGRTAWAGYASVVHLALALLREQEPVKPVKYFTATIMSDGPDGLRAECAVDSYRCGNCHKAIMVKPSFCPNCGRAVKWE